MKYFSFFFLLVLAPVLYPASDDHKNKTENDQPFAASFLYVNDNYIATWWPNYKEQYFGADDFLTVSMLSRVYWKDWKFSTSYTALTLRKFNYRYDILSAALTRKYSYHDLNYSLGAGLLYKGNLGGEKLQNEVHRLGDVKLVEMPYSKQSGTAFILQLTGSKNYCPELFNQDLFKTFIETRILSNYIASRFSIGVSYQWQFYTILQMEILSAFRGYLNTINEYSPMVRPGIVNALNLKINIYENLYVDLGFVQLPTKNILSDAIYDPYKNDYLPQAWISFSWNSTWFSLIEHLDY